MGKVGSYDTRGHVVPLRIALVGLVALVLGLLATTYAGASHVEPVAGPSNPQASDCPTGTVGWKYEPVSTGEDLGDGTLVVDVTVTETELGDTFAFSSNRPLVTVFVKGGTVSNRYNYDPAVTSDSGLHSPLGAGPGGSKYFGLSHLVFCYVPPPPKGDLVVIKEVVNDDGGTASPSDFTMNVAGPTPLSFPGAAAPGTTNEVDAGAYTVTESGPGGYSLTYSGDCNAQGQVTVPADGSATCILTNDDNDRPPPPEKGKIIVQKELIPDGYQPPQGGFVFSGAIQATLLDGESAEAEVDPGTYTVTESLEGRPFWDLISIVCDDDDSSGNLEKLTATYEVAAGETVKCVFTNQKRSLLVIEKRTNPENLPGDFDFTANYGDGSFTLSHGQNHNAILPAGSYSVAETVPDGWVLESATCSNGDTPDAIELPASSIVTCTFVNAPAPEPGKIIVEKVTDPAGDQTPFGFTFGDTSFSLADGESEEFPNLQAGTYSVSEDTPAGWELTSATCTDGSQPGSIDLSAGETVTCTFTNTKLPDPGTIVVRKQTDPAGDPASFDFTFGQTEFSLSDGESETFENLSAGSYSVSEDELEGWDTTSAACESDLVPGPIAPSQIDLSAGETVTCTFVNTKRGAIVVEKRTNPAGAGGFSFTGDAAGTIGDGQQIVVSNLVPGTYASTESAAAGWLLTSIQCSNAGSSGNLATRTATFDVGAGETVTCVFTNVQQTTGKGSIDVQKSANPTSVKEPGGPVTYSVRITNTSNVDISVTNVVDDKFGDLDDSGGNGCFDVPINLGPGQAASCQFVGQVTGAAGTEHVNVVCADAVDELGNPLKDCDDARVTITPKLIDLVIVKTATSPTPLNGTVNYSLTVTNKGPDTATNVVVADPAPAGVQYQTATPSQGSCAVGPALVTCQLGTLAAGQTVTIAIAARAIAVGTHVNTATVTGDGGRETNPSDNTDSAQTVVPAPLTPPVTPSKPKPVDVCVSLTVTPKMIKADGKKDRVVAKVRAAKKPMKGVRVVVRGKGVRKSGITNGKGVAVIVINPTKPGVITITTVGKGDPCGARRIGVVGVFLPPLTG